MSAVRREDRRINRTLQSSPYARRKSVKKSSWSITGLLNYLLPFRLTAQVDDESLTDVVSSQNSQNPPPPPAALAGSLRSSQNLSNQILPTSNVAIQSPNTSASAVPIIPPPSSLIHSLSNPSPSPARNFEAVTSFLQEKGNKHLSSLEAEGLVALIHQSTEPEEPERPPPFRFSTSPSVQARAATPKSGAATPSGSTPRKTLSKNPNGIYRWDGAGSARPRNRYRSPAFGPSRPSTPRLKLSTPEVPHLDNKRRRTSGEFGTSSTSHTSPATSTSINRSVAVPPASQPEASRAFAFPTLNGANPIINGTPVARKINGTAVPRLRTTGLPQPTAPAIPSPLRQTWVEPSESASPPPTKATKAATFMTELIKEVTPPKKPDVSNPYQTASPVKPPVKKPVRRTRATAKPAVPENPKKPELSPQAIIEATVPKGSKRSRPNFAEKPSSTESKIATSSRTSPPSTSSEPATNGINKTPQRRKVGTRSPPIVVEDLDDDQESEQAPKRRKPSPPAVNVTRRIRCSVTIEDVDDVDMPLASVPTFIRPAQVIEFRENPVPKPAPVPPISINTPVLPPSSVSPTSQTASRGLFGGVKSSAPKEPSKLRFSYQPELAASGSAPSTSTPTFAPTFAPASAPTPAPKSTPTPPQLPTPAEKMDVDPKEAALKMNVAVLPVFSFDIAKASTIDFSRHAAARNAAKSVPASSLPTFGFSTPLKPIGDTSHGKAVSAPTGVFDWAAAGMKPAVDDGKWTCSLCMLKNLNSAVDKCEHCDTPRPRAVEKLAPAFDWAAAGMKPPSKKDVWVCSTCMVDNPMSMNKCTCCETPR